MKFGYSSGQIRFVLDCIQDGEAVLVNLEGKIYSCKDCKTHLASYEGIISKLIPYDEKIDLWSLGCILAELCSGEVLFPNEAVAMILARIVAVLGPIEMEKDQETHKYFTKEFDLYHLNEESNEVEYIVTEASCLEDQLHVSDELFLDFVKDLLLFIDYQLDK